MIQHLAMTKPLLNIIALLCLIFLFQACTPELIEPLRQAQELKYTHSWKKLDNYPIKRGRTDDIHFFDSQTAVAINSEGYVTKTKDGGDTWEILHEDKGTFFRCIIFKNEQEGWLGTIGTDDKYLASKDSTPMYATKDGGDTWQPVSFNGPTPKGLCGLQKITDDVIVGCGRVRGPSYFIKTTDGGDTWNSYNLDHLAGSLIAPYFYDELHGLLIGGTTTDKVACKSLVLETFDGGSTWDTLYISKQKGEYCWKVSFPTPELGFISIQRNVRDGRFYHLRTDDGGKTWKEVEHAPSYYYVQGIGFINEKIGWIGGSNNWTYETRDGGLTWSKVKDIGRGFNNFRFFGDTLAYGVGFGIYKSTNIAAQSNQVITTYYDNGLLADAITYNNGLKDGKASIYYKNGQLKEQGQYQKNIKIGTWKFYNTDGRFLKKIKYKGGLAIVSPKIMESYVGSYQTPSGIVRKIFIENGNLYSQRGTGSKLIMYPDTNNRFFYGFNTNVTIEFIKDENGKVTHSQTFQNGDYERAEKLD